MKEQLTIETRTLEAYESQGEAAKGMELRIERSEGKPAKMVGYAARYNSLSKDLGGFRERILPGAFSGTIEKGADVRALVDHDSSKLLGRTSAGTLRLGTDDRGLWFQLDMPDTQYSRDTQALVDRGDIRGMSFGFKVPKGGDRFTRENEGAIRELTNVDLKEITVTSIPAYNETSLHMRIDPDLAGRIPPAPTPARASAAATLRRRAAE